VTLDPRPIWWRAPEVDPPLAWRDAFHFFTSDEQVDERGLAAAIFIARTRRRTGRGPSFNELFAKIAPEESGLMQVFPEGLNHTARFETRRAFRLHVAIQWKRRGWISWETGVERSLRTGSLFRERSRQRQAERAG
jgi:hypothetical protein